MKVLRCVLIVPAIMLVSLTIGCIGTEQHSTVIKPKLVQQADNQKATETNDVEENWNLVWQDEFDGESLNTKKWKYETGKNGWGNDEWQNYTAGDNLEVSNGTLKIIARKVGDGQKAGDYTSTRINSKKSFTYGRMEIRAKLPEHKGNGLWPAIWMLGENLGTAGWPNCGEIDILEYVSYEPDHVHFAIHSRANNHGDNTAVASGAVELESAEEEFHIYGILWTATQIQFFVDEPSNVQLTFDRPEEFNVDNWPFDRPQYFLLNVAVGGSWGGSKGVDDSIFPATMEVDYVRVYQPN